MSSSYANLEAGLPVATPVACPTHLDDLDVMKFGYGLDEPSQRSRFARKVLSHVTWMLGVVFAINLAAFHASAETIRYLQGPGGWVYWLAVCAEGRTRFIAGHEVPGPPDPEKYEQILDLAEAEALWEPQRAGLQPPSEQQLLLSGSLLRWWEPLHQLAARQAPPVALRTWRISDGQTHHTGLRIPLHFEAVLRKQLGGERA